MNEKRRNQILKEVYKTYILRRSIDFLPEEEAHIIVAESAGSVTYDEVLTVTYDLVNEIINETAQLVHKGEYLSTD